jgi:hypothetical protein
MRGGRLSHSSGTSAERLLKEGVPAARNIVPAQLGPRGEPVRGDRHDAQEVAVGVEPLERVRDALRADEVAAPRLRISSGSTSVIGPVSDREIPC